MKTENDDALKALEKITQEISALDSLVWQKEHQEAGVITNRLLGLTKDLSEALEAQDVCLSKNAENERQKDLSVKNENQAVDVEQLQRLLHNQKHNLPNNNEDCERFKFITIVKRESGEGYGCSISGALSTEDVLDYVHTEL